MLLVATVSGYSGTAGDAMTYHSGHKYTQHRIVMRTITMPPITKVHGGIITAMKRTEMASTTAVDVLEIVLQSNGTDGS